MVTAYISRRKGLTQQTAASKSAVVGRGIASDVGKARPFQRRLCLTTAGTVQEQEKVDSTNGLALPLNVEVKFGKAVCPERARFKVVDHHCAQTPSRNLKAPLIRLENDSSRLYNDTNLANSSPPG